MTVPAPTTPRADLLDYVRAFFATLAQPPAGSAPARTVESLERLRVLAGVYTLYTGPAIATGFGVSLQPRCALRVANRVIAQTGGAWSMEGVSLAAGQFGTQPLYYLQELVDAVHDDRATLERLLSDVANGAAWARAIAEAPDRATRFARALAEHTDAPPNSPVSDVRELVGVLSRHATYRGETGTYFQKWAGEGRSFPSDLHPDCRTASLTELPLHAGRVFCYGVCPARLFDARASARQMLEFVVRFERVPGATPPIQMRLVHAAQRPEVEQVFHQFCFFHTHDGFGLHVPEGAHEAMPPSVGRFLDALPSTGVEDYVALQQGFELTPAGAGPRKLRMAGMVDPAVPLTGLPAGVEVFDPFDDTGAPPGGELSTDFDDEANLDRITFLVRHFHVPVEQVAALAAHAAVRDLHEIGVGAHRLTDAHNELHHGTMLSNLAVTGGGGEGAFVGVIDYGIDGTHPAFTDGGAAGTTRIHAVWDQTQVNATVGEAPPSAISPSMNYGRVYRTTADVRGLATDTGGHGTHVAGIAAGTSAPGYAWPGVASKAKLIVVKLRGSASQSVANDEVVHAARWIFKEAADAGKPVVINLSWGHHEEHGHDGTDALSLALRGLVRNRDGSWKPGRIICASAGNERQDSMHAHVASLAPGATHAFPVYIRNNSNNSHKVNLYARPIPQAVRGCTVEVRVLGPGGATSTGWLAQQPDHRPAGGPFGGDSLLGLTRVRVTNGPPQPYTQHARPSVEFGGGNVIHPTTGNTGVGRAAAAGTWTIEVKNTSSVAIEVHGYTPEQLVNSNIVFTNPSEEALLLSPACGNGVVAVGASVNRVSWRAMGAAADTQNTGARIDHTQPTHPWVAANERAQGDYANFSCPGPVRGSRRTIHAMAPGSGVVSALSRQYAARTDLRALNSMAANRIDTEAIVKSGTSMSSPYVAGLIACLLGKNPRLTYAQVISELDRASDLLCKPVAGARPATCADADRDHSNDWGVGHLDAGRLRASR